MRVLALLFCGLASLSAQVLPSAPIAPEIPDDTVLAVFDDGASLTMRQFRAIFMALDGQQQRAAMNNRAVWLHQYALFRKLALMAEKEKLDQLTPIKEILEFQRMAALSQMQLNVNMNTTTVEGDEIVKAYESHKDKYKQVKVKAIYIAFLTEPLLKSGAKGLSEEQARAKAQKLVEEAHKGADFVQLVKANSDDKESREKDGDFSTMRQSDNIPDAIRTAVFHLNQGDVSEPIRQANGYYVFRAEEVNVRPLSEVRDEIYSEVKMKKHERWLAETDAGVKVKIVKEDFFKPSAPPSAAPVKPPAK